MFKPLYIVILLSFCYGSLSAQILKTDSIQRARLINALDFRQRYNPKINIDDVDVNDYNEMASKGMALYESGNYKDASALFKLADAFIEKHIANPNIRQAHKYYSSTPLFMMALCEIKLEHEAVAISLLNTVIEKDPLNVGAYDELGKLYVYQFKYDSAIIQFKKAIKVNARYEPALYHLSYTFYLSKMYQSAKNTLSSLIAMNSQNDQYHLLMAYITEERRAIKEAEKEYNDVVLLNSREGVSYFYRGAFLFRQKRYEEAIVDFRIAVQKDPSDKAYLSALTTALMLHSDFEEGADVLHRLVEKMDTTSSEFQLDLSLVETRDVLKRMLFCKMDSTERTQAIKLLGLVFKGVDTNSDEISSIVRAFPNSEIILRLYFLSLYASGKHEQFKYQVYKLHSINDKLPNTYMMEANLSSASNTNAKRIEAVKKALMLNDKNATYYYRLALLNAFDDSNCKRNIDKALALDPKFEMAYIAMGRIYQYKAEYDSALSYLMYGVQRMEAKADGYYIIGDCYLSKNRRDSALFFFTKTIRFNNKFYDAYLKRSEALVMYERYDDAHRDLDTVLGAFPESPYALDQRACVFAKEKKYEQALKVYASLLKKYPEDPDLLYARGNVYFEMEKYEPALTDYKRILSIWPGSIRALRRTGYTYLTLRDTSNANRYYKKLLEAKGSGFIDDYLYSASVYTEVGYYDEAIIYCGYALKSDSRNVSAYGNMGWAYYKKGDFENCIEYSKKAIEYDSTAMFAKFNIALCEVRLGHIENAKMLYKEYTEQNLRMGFPKPEGAINDLTELINKAIQAKECQLILDDIVKRYKFENSN